jgi:hypothetical protein
MAQQLFLRSISKFNRDWALIFVQH